MGLFTRNRAPAVRARAEVVHQRDPTAATRPLRYYSPGRPLPPDWNAEVAFQRAYYSNVVVYACINAIASTIAGLPFRAGPDPAKPTDHDPDAPLARLLGPPPAGPNPNMDAETLWYFLIVQYLVTGRLGAEIELDRADVPVALWPLVASHLDPIPSTSGINWFSHFVYGRPSDKRSLPTDRVLYAWQPKGTDFRQPESAIEAAGLDVSVAVMQGRYDYAFLKNDARPPAVVVTEQFENDDDYQAFKHTFESRHAGPDNAGRLAFVEANNAGEQGVKGAISIETLGFSPKDAQAAQRHSDAMQRIAVGLGVPWSRLDASGRTFDNASEEDKIWWHQRLLPLVRRLQAAVNIQLAPRVGSEVGWFDLSGIEVLQPEHQKIDAQGAATLYEAGIVTKDEARAPFGLGAVDDSFFEKPAPAPPAPVESAAGGDEDRHAPEHRDVEPPAAPPTPAEHRAPSAEEIEARRARIWSSAERTVTNLESIFAANMTGLFDRQRRSVVSRLTARNSHRARAAQRGQVDDIFDPDHWRTETSAAVRVNYEMIAAAGGARIADAFDLAFDLSAPHVQAFIAERSNALAGQVTDTTYRAIKAALAEGVLEGEGIPDLAKRIEGVFDDATRNRATMIARTETISAYNGSAATVAAQVGSGVVGAQEWIAARDARTREDHALADGQIVPVGQRFSVGGEPLAYPGDPSGSASNTVNCRCTLAFLTPDEADEHFGVKPRLVPIGAARALLRMVAPDTFDEAAFRAAVEVAA